MGTATWDVTAGTVLDVIVGALAQHTGVQRVILFGSRARGDARPDSDYDLLVVIDSPEANHVAASRAYDSARAVTSPDIEIQVVARKPGEFEARQDAPGTLDWDVAREGIVVWPPNAPPLPARYGLTSTAMVRRRFVREDRPPPELLPGPEVLAGWIERADDDLLEIEIHLKRDATREVVPWSSLAFHAQQAAEKYLKVLLIERGVQPPRTHKLEDMLDPLAVLGVNLESFREDCIALSHWAVDGRYPEKLPYPTPTQARGAAHAALRVVEAARRNRRGVLPL